jgi:hypothetical protein
MKFIKKLYYCRLVKVIPTSVYFDDDITQNIRIDIKLHKRHKADTWERERHLGRN